MAARPSGESARLHEQHAGDVAPESALSLVVDTRITAAKAGLDISTDELEAHFLAGGDIVDCVLALIAAEKAGIPLSYDRACAIDLAVKGTSKTVLEAVRTSINPRVIDCPNPSSGQTRLTAVARDGIAVAVRARVTVRTNLDLFVGGATEETVVARVGEGIVSAVGSAPSYKDVLEKPEVISRTVSDKGWTPPRRLKCFPLTLRMWM